MLLHHHNERLITVQPALATATRLSFDGDQDRINHDVFRFPARFHPPVARVLTHMFSQPGQRILDPFCGSGSLLVEALVAGRSAVGTDVDPLSVFIARAKVQRYRMGQLANVVEQLCDCLLALRDRDLAEFGDFVLDLPLKEYIRLRTGLEPLIPPIPNLLHWFRPRVITQLATIRRALIDLRPDAPTRSFLGLCFASIIRNASNADPVPVSGLEVTKHMRQREAEGRSIDPYELMVSATRRTFAATERFVNLVASKPVVARVALADARELSGRGTGPVDSIITSPPYPNAVDYYRRHQLETYWLGLVRTARERLSLLPRYIGRDRVGNKDLSHVQRHPEALRKALQWLEDFGPLPKERANSFVHYCIAMSAALRRFATVVRTGSPIVIVIGDGRIRGKELKTTELIQQLAAPWLKLENILWYPLVNRYMSYSRRNGADIDTEYALVFRPAREHS